MPGTSRRTVWLGGIGSLCHVNRLASGIFLLWMAGVWERAFPLSQEITPCSSKPGCASGPSKRCLHWSGIPLPQSSRPLAPESQSGPFSPQGPNIRQVMCTLGGCILSLLCSGTFDNPFPSPLPALLWPPVSPGLPDSTLLLLIGSCLGPCTSLLGYRAVWGRSTAPGQEDQVLEPMLGPG